MTLPGHLVDVGSEARARSTASGGTAVSRGARHTPPLWWALSFFG